MKFYFSSFEIGANPDKLKDLLPEKKKAVYIANALDRYGDSERAHARREKDMQQVRDIGVTVEPLDLRDYFGKKDELARRLREVGLIWVSGGNTFDLRIAMKLSGFDDVLKSMLTEDVVYGGYSAGVCVLSESLKGYDIIDSPEGNPYGQETIWNGVGLIHWMFVPHFDSDHEESEDTVKEVAYYTKHGLAYKTLRHGEVIIVN